MKQRKKLNLNAEKFILQQYHLEESQSSFNNSFNQNQTQFSDLNQSSLQFQCELDNKNNSTLFDWQQQGFYGQQQNYYYNNQKTNENNFKNKKQQKKQEPLKIEKVQPQEKQGSQMNGQQIKNNQLKQVQPTMQKDFDKLIPPEEPKQILDPKLGYWTFTQQEHVQFKEKVNSYKVLKQQYDDHLKEQRMLEQRKRGEKYAKLKEKQQRRNNLLGMKKINLLIRELRIQYNKYVRKEKKKQFGFTLDEQNNVQIIEQDKKKKLSKLKRAKQLWDDMQDSSYETVDEEEQNQQLTIKSILEKMSLKNPFTQCSYNNMAIRPWINQIPCKELDDQTLKLINELSYLQAKKKVIEPKKFKKRVVAGMKECFRSVQYTLLEKQSKLIIIPINIQEYPVRNGPDHEILKILKESHLKNVPVLFASNRSKLARAFCGRFGSKISVLSIINYQNAEEQFNELLQLRARQIQEFQAKYGEVNLTEYYNYIQ